MKPGYKNYSLEELLEDKKFISYIKRGESKKEWDAFISAHGDLRYRVEKARKMYILLQENYNELDEESVLELWNRINQFDNEIRHKSRRLIIRKYFSLAASVLLLVAIGVAGNYFNLKNGIEYEFSTSEILKNGRSRIVLSTGEEIALERNNSTIELSDHINQISINDSIIELNKDHHQQQKVLMNEMVIPYGQKSEIILADGTKVWLNAGSRFAFPTRFSGKFREVYLEGEACFDVIENKDQPFVVKTGDLMLKVLGTRFVTTAYPTDHTVETVLLNGKVSISQVKSFSLKNMEVILQPHQKMSFNKEQKNFSVTDESEVDMYIAWTYGWLKYEKESLLSVLQKVERYYNVEIALPDNYPGDDKLSGKLDLNRPIADVMIVLADASGFNFRIKDNRITIEKKLEKINIKNR